MSRRVGHALIGIAAVLLVHGVMAATPGKIDAVQAKPTAPASDENSLFARWDTDHNGSLSQQEFRNGWQQLQAAAETQRLHEQFVAMDTDKNGCLNTVEYAHLSLIHHAGPSAPSMALFDVEKNNCLDFKEYVAVVKYMVSRGAK